ncbi:dienelactone hydrolase [Stereum hirsutum FP-91666 SS1]|uniref:dienelactone hydrolase n=1 Tax=Stereum hirsutum (strain FP-91666) TaxID=721885 RepID=UPI0004449B88|nr:dienelactone hydrolase [Stereum hirsutum FP-91666 SS1]EIM82003.1 dienelactone hydrolase [Stereum hirsutum FP-91666 SS1]
MSSGDGFCDDCFKLVKHEGTPEGTFETFDGIKTYIATPTSDYPKDKAIFFISDVFGHALNNNFNGFKTYMPDLFNGDPAPLNLGEPGVVWDRATWGPRHLPEMRSRLDKVVKAMKEQGLTKFGAVGYCFGARYVFDYAFEKIIDVAVVTHPSRLEIPDLEKYAVECTAPLLINSCEVDPQFPKEKQEAADKFLGGGKFAPGYSQVYWEGCTHGFACRGDISDPKVKAGKEGSFKNAVEWFQKYL